MEFEQVLRTVLAEFERHHLRYAVIGGFALGALDFLHAFGPRP